MRSTMNEKGGKMITEVLFYLITASQFVSTVGFTMTMAPAPIDDHKITYSLTFDSTPEPPICMFDYGDGIIESFRATSANAEAWTYQYNVNNFYDIHVFCMTNDSVATDTNLNIYAGNFLTGFVVSNAPGDVLQIYAPLTGDVDVDLRIDNGTDVTLTATLMQDVQVVERSGWNVSIGEANIMTFSQSNFPTNGLYTLNATAVNPITAMMERYIIIAIQEEVVVTSVSFGGTNYVEVGTPFDIDLTLSSGEDVTITYDIYNITNTTVVDSLAFSCEGITREHTFTYQINETGTFYVRASVSNMASAHTEMITVISQNAVSASAFNFGVSGTFPALATAFGSFSVVSTGSLGDIIPAGVISCVIEFGNGKNHTFGSDLTTAPTMPLSVLQNIVYDAGFYVPKLTCFNEIPTNFTIEKDMIRIENTVDNIALGFSTDYIPLSEGVDLNVTLIDDTQPPLYLITCNFDFGDGNPSINVTGNVTSSERIEIHYNYTRSGAFTITVLCAGDVPGNELQLTLDVDAYWDCWQSLQFFESFKTTDLPLTFFGHEELKLSGTVTLSATCTQWTQFLQYIWTLLGPLPDESTEAYSATNTLQSHKVPANRLNKGKYKLVLNSTFTNLDGAWQSDYMYIESKLPDLVPVLKGSTDKIVQMDTDVLIEAGDSNDPAAGLSEVANTPLVLDWSCKKSPTATSDEVSLFFASGGNDLVSIATDDCGVTFDTGIYTQTFKTSLYPAEVWYFFQFTMTRGGRTKSVVQAIKPVYGDPLNLEMKCQANCHGKKLEWVTIQRGVNILDDDVDLKYVTYSWSFKREDGSSFVDLTDQLSGTDAVDISIPTAMLTPGASYRLSCDVDAPDKRVTYVSESFVVNLSPYDGDCSIDRTEGKSGQDYFCVTCSGWVDESDRNSRSDIDDEASLTYEFVQINEGAKVSEIIHKSFDQKKYCMDLALPMNTTNQSVVIVKIKDKWLTPAAEKSFTVTVLPPLDVTAISATGGSEGAEAVSDFAGAQAEKIEKALQSGDIDSVGPTVAMAMSNLEAINVEVPPPALKEEVEDDGGGLIDMAVDENGTVIVQSSKDMLADFSAPPVLDETTKVMQDNCDRFTDLLTESMEKTLPFDKSTTVNPIDVSISAKGFMSILATDKKNLKANTTKKIATNIEKMSELIENSQVPPDSADTQATIRDMQKLDGGLINAVVPNALKLIKPVSDRTSAGVLTDALYLLADPETQALRESALLSPDERKYGLLKSNLKKKLEVQKTVDAEEAQKAAKAFRKISDAIQHSIPKSIGHRDQIGDKVDTVTQIVSTNLGASMAAEPLVTNFSSVAVEELASFPGEAVTVSITESKESVFMWDAGGDSARLTSATSRLKFDMQSSLTKPVKVEQKIDVPAYTRRTPVVNEEDASGMDGGYYITLVESVDDQLCIAVKPTEPIVEKFEIYINFGSNPTEINKYAVGEVSESNDWNVCFTKSQRTDGNGVTQIGIWHYSVRAVYLDSYTSSRKRRSASDPSSSPSFDMATATMACMTWNSDTDSWESDSCESSKWRPDAGVLECTCTPTNNELTFANSFYVPPNNIDFSTVFLKFSPASQAAVMAALIFVFVVYILIIIWAKRQDKKDLLKWGITPLVDNFPEDCYFYVVKVFTGMRPGAGTKSKVAFVLSGDEMDTGVRELTDGIRQEFRTGSIMNFLLSTNSSLGQLEYMRVWHDNSGGGSDSSWYLSKIEVQDVQLNETFIFQAERWLAVEREDGALECIVPVNKRNDLNVFRNRFFQNAKDNLADNHVWISVVYRPSSSTFTRVQRATCALVFVMLTMIANAMFFRSEDNYETPAVVRVGPFRFSLQQIYISIICALITTPPTILIIYLFKMSKRKLPKHHESLYRERRARKYTVPFWDDWVDTRLKESMELEQHLVMKGYPQMKGFYLPYACNYVAWFLAFSAVVLSGFFLMLYSMQWGKQKSEEWLTTFLLSFFESVLCLDPVKVAMMALIFALVFRSAKDSTAMIERKTIMKQYSSSMRGKSCGMRLPAPPLDNKRLEEARYQRKKEMMMKSALKNVIVNLFMCWILFSISYSNRDNRSYFLHEDVVKQILKPEGKPQFMDIKSINTFFDWLNQSAILQLFPEIDEQGEQLHWRERQFIYGGASLRLGPPRLRQLRVKTDICPIEGISSKNCYAKYFEPDEETASYCIGWVSGECDPKDEIYKYSSAAWKFTSALDIWGFPVTGYYTTYGGGGYIALLDVNRDVSQYILDELYLNSWVDRQTRAVFLEFTIYCLNANIFMYNLFVVEFPETGGAFPYHILLPLRVYQHNGSTGVYTLACEVIFVVFLLILTIQMIINMVQQKCEFFKKFWQLLDMIFVIVGYLAIGMYIVRFIMTSATIEKFQEDKKQFVNFYHIALWDQLFVLLIGILDFIITIRLLHILGYNKRISAVSNVFSSAASELLWFGIFFLNIFTCYAVFGYLLFGSKLKSYMNVYATMGTLFISMIGKSRFTEIENTDPIMSKIYFMIFIFFVVYCILTMFLAVLSKSIENVHADLKKEKGEEMVDFLINKMKNMIGYGLGDRKKAQKRGRPPAPWTDESRRFFEIDNRSILQSIRMSLHEALKESQEETGQNNATKSSKKRK